MPTLNIEGRKVTVDDSFLKLSPEQQNSTVDEIASSFKTQTAQTKPEPTASLPQQILSGFNNQRIAAGQLTSPHVEAYGNPISDRVYENDAGDALYLDPQTGELAKTDTSKHVILTDPADNKMKVYARNPNTDEGRLSAAGRLLGTGLASSPPTLRASQALTTAAPTVQAAQELRPGQQVIAAADRLSAMGAPVQVPRAVATDNMPVQQMAAAASNVPIAGTPLVKAAEQTIKQLGTKADEVAQGYGGGASVANTGEVTKGSIIDWITKNSAEGASKLYGKVDELIDPAIQTDLSATRQAAQSILNKRANSAISETSGAVKRIEDAVTRPGGLNYEGIKDLRSYVRELKDKPSLLPADISGKELEAIYGALLKDLKSSAYNAGGPNALAAFERANRHYKLISDRRESLAKIVGDGSASAETVFSRLEAMAGSTSRADISKLAQARKAMGADDWNEFASTVISRLGRDVEGQFKPERFITAYGKISDQGKNILFRSGGKEELAGHLDDIAKVSSRFKELQKFANPSGSARAGLGGLIGAGAFAEPLTTLTTVLGGRVVAAALARPAGAASIAKWSRANEALVRVPSPAKLYALNTASRNLISTLGARDITPADFLKSLQGPIPAGATDEQQ